MISVQLNGFIMDVWASQMHPKASGTAHSVPVSSSRNEVGINNSTLVNVEQDQRFLCCKYLKKLVKILDISHILLIEPDIVPTQNQSYNSSVKLFQSVWAQDVTILEAMHSDLAWGHHTISNSTLLIY